MGSYKFRLGDSLPLTLVTDLEAHHTHKQHCQHLVGRDRTTYKATLCCRPSSFLKIFIWKKPYYSTAHVVFKEKQN